MSDPEANPYVGPRTFEAEHSDVFFGRDREARKLLSLVVANRLVVFYAQSGAGKSSLINTRLRPQLEEEGFELLPVCRVSGELLAEVEGKIESVSNVFVFNLLLNLHHDQRTAATLAEIKLADFLESYKEKTRVDAGAREPARVLIVDQFEEIFTAHLDRWQQREDFFRQLKQALSKDRLLWVVLVMREDYVGALDRYARLVPGRFRVRFFMQRMGREAALAAVEGPAEKFGVPFEPGAAGKLVDNLRLIRVPGRKRPQLGEFVEPVHLQVVCYQLWENLKKKVETLRQISEDDVETLGDVDSALARFYEQAVLETAAETGCSERTLHDWFRDKLITEARTRGTVYRGKKQTGGLDNEVVNALTRRFLLRAELRAGGKWYELVHDRFVEPILAATRDWWAKQDAMLQSARKWNESGGNPHYLYLGERLASAKAQVSRQSLDPLVRDFFDASEEADAELEQQLEIVRQLKKYETKLWTVGGVLGCTFVPLLVVYVIMALVSIATGAWFEGLGILAGLLLVILVGASLGRSRLRVRRKRRTERESAKGRLRIFRHKLEAEERFEGSASGSSAQWRIVASDLVLQFAPLWVFVAVAGADGKVDVKELRALLRGLDRVRRRGTRLEKEVLVPLVENLDQTLKQFDDDGLSVAAGLMTTAEIVEQKGSPEEVRKFKRRLLSLGRKIAHASGFGPIGWTSQQEKEALAAVARFLGMAS